MHTHIPVLRNVYNYNVWWHLYKYCAYCIVSAAFWICVIHPTIFRTLLSHSDWERSGFCVTFQFLTTACMMTSAMWDVAPCSLVETEQHFRGAYCLCHQGALIIEAVSISETYFDFYRTTRHNNPEDSHLRLEMCVMEPCYNTHFLLIFKQTEGLFLNWLVCRKTRIPHLAELYSTEWNHSSLHTAVACRLH
jgi:hypothetical protein